MWYISICFLICSFTELCVGSIYEVVQLGIVNEDFGLTPILSREKWSSKIGYLFLGLIVLKMLVLCCGTVGGEDEQVEQRIMGLGYETLVSGNEDEQEKLFSTLIKQESLLGYLGLFLHFPSGFQEKFLPRKCANVLTVIKITIIWCSQDYDWTRFQLFRGSYEHN